MPREQGGAGGDQTREGAAGEGERRDRSGPGDDWKRIETEQAQRDAIGRKWDATHDPSPEFDNSARPLGPDYGRDRPKHREYTPEQQAELEATYARPIQELLALRDQDPAPATTATNKAASSTPTVVPKNSPTPANNP